MSGTDAKALARAAFEAREKAYAPYSRFTVGAALLCADGTVYTGCNIENAAFSPSVCAERVALFKAVSDGRRGFRAIAVVGGAADRAAGGVGYCRPCGVCRQALSEFCGPELEIITARSPEDVRTETLGQLLPGAFGKDDLAEGER